jgi:hypothetical protein
MWCVGDENNAVERWQIIAARGDARPPAFAPCDCDHQVSNQLMRRRLKLRCERLSLGGAHISLLLLVAWRIGQSGLVGNPICFPSLAAIVRKGLLEMRRIGF